jgi:uncharacterized membrane protein YqjE
LIERKFAQWYAEKGTWSKTSDLLSSSGGCMIQVLFTLIAVVGASVHLALSPKRRSSGAAIAGTYLLYLLFFYVGLWECSPRMHTSSVPLRHRRP